MNKVDKLYKVVEENGMSGEEVLNLFLYYYGNQIITKEFFEHIEDEGYFLPVDE